MKTNKVKVNGLEQKAIHVATMPKSCAKGTLSRLDQIAEVRSVLSKLQDLDGSYTYGGFDPAPTLVGAGSSKSDEAFDIEDQEFDYDFRVLAIKTFDFRKKSLTPGEDYYEWQAVTTTGGLYMDINGRLYTANLTGGGIYMNFPRRGPGDADVGIQVEYQEVGSLENLTKTDLKFVLGSVRRALKSAQRMIAQEQGEKVRNEILVNSYAKALMETVKLRNGNGMGDKFAIALTDEGFKCMPFPDSTQTIVDLQKTPVQIPLKDGLTDESIAWGSRWMAHLTAKEMLATVKRQFTNAFEAIHGVQVLAQKAWCTEFEKFHDEQTFRYLTVANARKLAQRHVQKTEANVA